MCKAQMPKMEVIGTKPAARTETRRRQLELLQMVNHGTPPQLAVSG